MSILGQITLLLLEICLGLITLYGALLLARKYYFSNSYIKVADEGLELQTVNWKLELVNSFWTWDKIQSVSESYNFRDFRFRLILKSGQVIDLPRELYLNSFRINAIIDSLIKKRVKVDFGTYTFVILIFKDLALILGVGIITAIVGISLWQNRF